MNAQLFLVFAWTKSPDLNEARPYGGWNDFQFLTENIVEGMLKAIGLLDSGFTHSQLVQCNATPIEDSLLVQFKADYDSFGRRTFVCLSRTDEKTMEVDVTGKKILDHVYITRSAETNSVRINQK